MGAHINDLGYQRRECPEVEYGERRVVREREGCQQSDYFLFLMVFTILYNFYSQEVIRIF